MREWAGGYVTDLEYTYGFYRELTPSLLSLALLWNRTGSPSPDAQLSYCELGCGQGVSANILAAANPHIDFHATDFNPGQISFARELADAAGLKNMRFYEDSFAEFAERRDLPDFDIISFHGIYSWIKDEYRANIREIIRRRLKPGGIVYVSYNCFPGWAPAAPMRHLLYLHGKSHGGPTATRVGPALDFVSKLEENGARYFKANPTLKQRLENLRKQDRNYVAHEYMNDVWKMMYFSDVATELSDAKLAFSTSANLLDAIHAINLTKPQIALLQEIADPVLRESTRDYMVNQQFRRDIFVKGRVALRQDVYEEKLANTSFVLTVPLVDLSLKLNGALGEATANENLYKPVAAIIAEGPKSASEIIADPRASGLKPGDVIQALYVLTGMGQAHPCLSREGFDARRKSAQAMNRAILERSAHLAELRYLASPVTGGGHIIDRVSQFFLLAETRNAKPLAFADGIMKRRGERLVIDGKTVTDEAAHTAELEKRYAAFQEKQLPLLRRLGIV